MGFEVVRSTSIAFFMSSVLVGNAIVGLEGLGL